MKPVIPDAQYLPMPSAITPRTHGSRYTGGAAQKSAEGVADHSNQASNEAESFDPGFHLAVSRLELVMAI